MNGADAPTVTESVDHVDEVIEAERRRRLVVSDDVISIDDSYCFEGSVRGQPSFARTTVSW